MTTIKQTLTINQANLAEIIFNYIGCVDSVCQAKEVILKNIHEKKYALKVDWMRGYAQYCSKHGRIEQAIVLYQKALKISATGNLLKEYLELKDELVKINQDKE